MNRETRIFEGVNIENSLICLRDMYVCVYVGMRIYHASTFLQANLFSYTLLTPPLPPELLLPSLVFEPFSYKTTPSKLRLYYFTTLLSGILIYNVFVVSLKNTRKVRINNTHFSRNIDIPLIYNFVNL